MLQHLFRPVLCLVLIGSLSACRDDENRVISEHTSPAGHTFQLMPIKERGVTDITVSAAWKTDWLNDADNNPLVPYLATEMMLSGGTSTLSPAETLELLEDTNSYGNIHAASDLIYAEVEFPNNHQEIVLPVLTELFQTPVFDPKWFDRIKAQNRDRIASADIPLYFEMWEGARFAVFGMTNQTRFLNANDLAALDAIKLDDFQRWHDQSFTNPPIALVVTGPVYADEAGKIIDALLPAPTALETDSFIPTQATFPDRMIYLHDPEAEKSILGYVGPLPDTRDGHDGLDVVLTHLFAGGADSPLFNTIRTELGASYGMQVELVNYSRTQRAFAIAGEIDTDKMAEARDAVLKAYGDFRSAPDLTGLPDISERIADKIRQEMVYVSSSARMIRELLLDGRDPQDYQTLADTIQNTSEDAAKNRLLTAFPAPEDLSIFAAGPDPSVFPDACIITTPIEALEC